MGLGPGGSGSTGGQANDGGAGPGGMGDPGKGGGLQTNPYNSLFNSPTIYGINNATIGDPGSNGINQVQAGLPYNPTLLPGQEGFNVPQFGNFEDAGTYGMNQAAALYGQGPAQQFPGSRIAGFGDYSQNAFQGLQDQGGPDNPFLQGFQNFQNMQNPYLDAMAQQGQTQIADQMNSMFGGSGRGGSAYHAGTTGRALGDFQTNLRGNAFDNMMNRNLQAQGLGSNAYQNQFNQGLDYNQALQDAGQRQDLMSQLQLSDEVSRFDQEQNAPWENLQNFQSIVSGLNPTQPPPRAESSTMDSLLGLGMLGLGIF